MLLPVPESMYPWVMMILMALLLAPVEFASPCSHSGRYHRVRLQTRSDGPGSISVCRRSIVVNGHSLHAPRVSVGCSMRVYDSSYSRGGQNVYTRENRAGARGRSRGPRVQPAQRP